MGTNVRRGLARNKELVRRYYEDVVSTGAIDRVAEFVSPEYVEVLDGARHPIGLEGARAHIRKSPGFTSGTRSGSAASC